MPPPKTNHYKTLADADNYDGSSTEVEELMDEEKHWHSVDLGGDKKPKKSLWKRCKAMLKKYRWLIDTLLLLTNIGLSLGLSLLMYYQFEDAKFPRSLRQVGGDFTGAGPTFPTKVVHFAADYSFVPPNATDFLSNATMSQRKSIMPVGTGWKPVGNDPFFTTSMTHQLHCIFMMGRSFSALASNASRKLEPEFETHFFHCIDYLRQSVMCSGDVAMEPHEVTDPDDNGPGDGSWNGQHVCKDYSQVTKYLDRQIAEGIRVVLPIDD
ncbi:Oxidase ustYa [Colletotrichum spinosum]|uniref:Oxidase ustYa n=1 Tax=Colletotrichum spinosum TaxID=1347390 RepID=A0A4R8PPU1_9PEZI|nr:Oxidase ustYa [Colletotrichum spinosum]